MRCFLLLVSFLTAALATFSIQRSAALEAWMDGVSRTNGWYDYNKTWTTKDSNLCWAATSSNVLSWWQERMVAVMDRPAEEPSGMNIFATFTDNFENKGVLENDAFQWWLSGKIGEFSAYALKKDASGGGYYRSILPDSLIFSSPTTQDQLLYQELWWYGTAGSANILQEVVTSAFSLHYGTTLSINYDNGNVLASSHSLALWGVEYDESSGRLTKVFITDPDDNMNDKYNNGIWNHDPTLVTLNCAYNQENGLIYLTEEGGTGGRYSDHNAYIGTITGLRALTIPEPSTAFLFLLSAAFCPKRRRC